MSETMDYRLTPTQVIEPQYESGSIEVGPRKAFTKAGLAEATSLFFQRDGAVLLAVGTDYEADGRSDKNGRRLHKRGTVTIPSHFYDVIDVDVEAVQDGDAPQLAVYAGDGVLALRPIDAIDVSVDWAEVPG